MKAAFIMSARTPNNDYVMDKFLVVPDDFGEEENRKIHAYIKDKTKHLQTETLGCIRVNYYDEKFIVLGIGTYISALYDKCEHEWRYCLDSKERQRGKLPRRYPVFLGFAFRRKDAHEAFDVTFELLAEYYDRYISKFWEKPLIFGGMESVLSPYEEISFGRISDASKVAVSLTSEMLRKPAPQKNEIKGEETPKEQRNSFSIVAVVLIGVAIASAILGAVLLKNFVQGNSPQKAVLFQERQ